jgi:hypothetical protein
VPNAAAGLAPADHLTGIVDVQGDTVQPTERAEIGHHPVLPQEGVDDMPALRIFGVPPEPARSDHVVLVVDREGLAFRAPQGAEPGHRAVHPAEGSLAAQRAAGPADHLPEVIDVEGSRFAATQVSQIVLDLVLPDVGPHDVVRPGLPSHDLTSGIDAGGRGG